MNQWWLLLNGGPVEIIECFWRLISLLSTPINESRVLLCQHLLFDNKQFVFLFLFFLHSLYLLKLWRISYRQYNGLSCGQRTQVSCFRTSVWFKTTVKPETAQYLTTDIIICLLVKVLYEQHLCCLEVLWVKLSICLPDPSIKNLPPWRL